MSKTSFKAVLSYHNRVSVVLLKQLEKHQKILALVQTTLPVTLAMHTKDCVIKGRKLVIFTTSAAWASQLRFYSSALLTKINSYSTETIELIQFKIHQPEGHPQVVNKPRKKAQIPSSGNISLIYKNIIDSPDSKLKESLIKLNNKHKQLHKAGGRG